LATEIILIFIYFLFGKNRLCDSACMQIYNGKWLNAHFFHLFIVLYLSLRRIYKARPSVL